VSREGELRCAQRGLAIPQRTVVQFQRNKEVIAYLEMIIESRFIKD